MASSLVASTVFTTPGDTSGTLVALAPGVPMPQIFYIAACIYTSNNALAKLFVVKDPSGLETLKKEELHKTLTGGPIKECVLINLKNAL